MGWLSVHMNTTPDTTTTDTPAMPDPRADFARVVQAVGGLIESTTEAELGLPTPCPEFTVKELLEHLVLIPTRAAAVGRGEHWTTTADEPRDSGWHDAWMEANHAVMDAWTDPAKLGQEYEVPWGTFPGAAILIAWTGEIAVHGWDLATARGVDFSIDDDFLQVALVGAKFIPAEGRDDPMVPFGPVVDPGPDASVLLQIAGWMGRDVLS